MSAMDRRTQTAAGETWSGRVGHDDREEFNSYLYFCKSCTAFTLSPRVTKHVSREPENASWKVWTAKQVGLNRAGGCSMHVLHCVKRPVKINA